MFSFQYTLNKNPKLSEIIINIKSLLQSHNSGIHIFVERPVICASHTLTFKFILLHQNSFTLISFCLCIDLTIVFGYHFTRFNIFNGMYIHSIATIVSVGQWKQLQFFQIEKAYSTHRTIPGAQEWLNNASDGYKPSPITIDLPVSSFSPFLNSPISWSFNSNNWILCNIRPPMKLMKYKVYQ
jgi:hypothetical protein